MLLFKVFTDKTNVTKQGYKRSVLTISQLLVENERMIINRLQFDIIKCQISSQQWHLLKECMIL